MGMRVRLELPGLARITDPILAEFTLSLANGLRMTGAAILCIAAPCMPRRPLHSACPPPPC